MADEKIQMPSGMGGLVRYFDEYKSRLKIKPGHVIFITIVVILIMVLLYTFGDGLLGIG